MNTVYGILKTETSLRKKGGFTTDELATFTGLTREQVQHDLMLCITELCIVHKMVKEGERTSPEYYLMERLPPDEQERTRDATKPRTWWMLHS